MGSFIFLFTIPIPLQSLQNHRTVTITSCGDRCTVHYTYLYISCSSERFNCAILQLLLLPHLALSLNYFLLILNGIYGRYYTVRVQISMNFLREGAIRSRRTSIEMYTAAAHSQHAENFVYIPHTRAVAPCSISKRFD